MPHACIGADVMVGFPGETIDLFNETVDFIKSLEISYLHVFSYSERQNTTAINLRILYLLKNEKLEVKF